MNIYKTKARKLSGTDFKEIHQKAVHIYEVIRKRSKRRTYIRSIYFGKNKIFLGIFWQHVYEKKNYGDQMRRMKYFPCAIELIQNSHCNPTTKENPNKKSELLHRFYGSTPENEHFIVQIKEDKRSGEKFLISIFPA